MTKTLGSILVWIANVLHATDRGCHLQRHGGLARQFALVAPLGGGAVVAFQALHLPEGDHGSQAGSRPLRGRSPWGWAL